MKPKQILILLAILALLIAGVVIKHFQKPPELVTEEYTPLNLSFDLERVAKIQIGKGGAADDPQSALLINIIRSNTPGYQGWRIPDFSDAHADKEKIERFLKKIQEAKGEIRARDKSLFGDFAIKDDEAYRVTLFDMDWKEILVVVIGAKRAGASNFIRQGNADLVYMTNSDFLSEMGIYGDPKTEKSKVEFWTSLNLLDFDADKVEKLEIKRLKSGSEIVTANVVRETDSGDSTKKRWKYIRPDVPFAIDAEKAKQFLSAAKNWRANKVLDPHEKDKDTGKEKDFGFSAPQWRMKLTLEAAVQATPIPTENNATPAAPEPASPELKTEEIMITAGNTDPDTKALYMQVSTGSIVFEVAEYVFKNMDIDDSKFFVDNPLAIDPDKIENLVIRADKKEMTFQPKTKKWDSLTTYLNDLKGLTVSKLLFDPSEQKKVGAASRYVLEIQKEGGTPQTFNVGDLISEQPKEYAALKIGTQPFAISESAYKTLFENLDRLAEPQTAAPSK